MDNKRINLNQWIDLNVYNIDIEQICSEIRDDLFESRFFSNLRELNRTYGFVIRLYFSDIDEIKRLLSTSVRIHLQLTSNSTWIKIGWTQKSTKEYSNAEEIGKEIEEYFEKGYNILDKNSFGISSLITQPISLGISSALTPTQNHRLIFLSDNLIEEDSVKKDEFDKRGFFLDKNIEYRKADILIDLSEYSEDYLSIFKEKLNDYPRKLYIIVVCSGNTICRDPAIVLGLFENVQTINKKIYINASTMVGRHLYFTADNLNNLFKMDLDSYSIESVSIIPSKSNNSIRFSSIIHVEDSLWLIPWMEENIYVYNLKNRTMETIHFPDEIPQNDKRRFRKALLFKEYIFLLPRYGSYFLELDVKNRSVKKYDISKYTHKDNLSNGYGYEGITHVNNNIIFFGDQYNSSVVYDIDNNSIKKYDIDTDGGYIVPTNDGRVLVIPTFCKNGLRIYDSDYKLLKTIELPEDAWQNKSSEYYWYSKKIGKYVYISSIELGTILLYDIIDDSIKIIRWPNKEYDAVISKNGFTGYDTYKVNDEVWITSYTGNHILKILPDGQVAGTINLYVPLYQLSTTGINSGLYESRFYTLEVFLNSVRFFETTLRAKK